MLNKLSLNKTLELSVMVLSILGALLTSFAIFEGFILFFIANVLGIWFFKRTGMKYMLINQIFYLLISINGICHNLL